MTDRNKFDTSFLRDIEKINPAKAQEFALEEMIFKANDLLSGLSALCDKKDASLSKNLNKKLATGHCFIKDNVLFFREEDGSQTPIWFPQGNAIQWQSENGMMSDEVADKLLPIVNKLNQLNKPDGSEQG